MHGGKRGLDTLKADFLLEFGIKNVLDNFLWLRFRLPYLNNIDHFELNPNSLKW